MPHALSRAALCLTPRSMPLSPFYASASMACTIHERLKTYHGLGATLNHRQRMLQNTLWLEFLGANEPCQCLPYPCNHNKCTVRVAQPFVLHVFGRTRARAQAAPAPPSPHADGHT